MTTFYFVRHGQTNANAKGLKQGVINTEITYLNEVGKAQAESLHKVFDISFADRIIASPLKRTIDTANTLNQTANLPVTTDDRLLEISYGGWDGQSNKELQQKYPDVFDANINDVLPSYAKLAHGETFSSVIKRVENFMEEMATEYPDEQIIVVSHGFTIKAAMLVATQTDKVMTINEPDNCSVTKIQLSQTANQAYIFYFNRSAIGQF
ncbi:histidine phosphatase family protein [Lentilactobacillus sp. Marseille-Q4993]|uniref:histidine phosphatase family protein n=1 Tax=Lentilactobacillus sp. Marseille-Q4993 TaxID=3039492 RepID=UPI0024BD4F72|nr:histidine phosphatase family protein [Lentilactobacillus sp. Marseille-Q4993]